MFSYFWCFLELFIGKFILNINNEHAQLLPRGNFCVLFTRRKVTSARRVTRCCTTGNPPLEVASGQRKTHVNCHRRQTLYRDKIDPEISELPRGNELSWDHVNRPLVCVQSVIQLMNTPLLYNHKRLFHFFFKGDYCPRL